MMYMYIQYVISRKHIVVRQVVNCYSIIKISYFFVYDYLKHKSLTLLALDKQAQTLLQSCHFVHFSHELSCLLFLAVAQHEASLLSIQFGRPSTLIRTWAASFCHFTSCARVVALSPHLSEGQRGPTPAQLFSSMPHLTLLKVWHIHREGGVAKATALLPNG